MARIAGVEIPRNKVVGTALTYVYGIGRPAAGRILQDARVNPQTRVKDLSEDELSRIRAIIDKSYKVEGELRAQVSLDIKRLQDISCYRGIRHKQGLPVRGQRTRHNARTRTGPRKTVAGKKQASEKK